MTTEQALDNKLIVFELEEEEYAIPVHSIGSIERILPITRVPAVESFVKGVINLRGIVTPVIDLKERFFQKETKIDEQARIIIVHIGELSVGLIVEAANDVIDINREQIEPPPEVVGGVNADYLAGVIKLEKRLLILLELEQVLSKDNMNDLKALKG